ncbi:MAG: biopolymer transporter ExbD [candidate division WOR-3 bacterium]|nr:MAG: biopolymer transporter ExbD [candidate division WOR-3 bacterium]
MHRRIRSPLRKNELILTSLVDIALSLVIGFIVAVPLFFETGIFVSAPGVSRAAADEEGSDIKANIFVADDGTVLLNEAQVSYENLADLLPKLLDRSLERKVVVAAGELVEYDMVMKVLDIAKQSGAADLALLRKRRAN